MSIHYCLPTLCRPPPPLPRRFMPTISLPPRSTLRVCGDGEFYCFERVPIVDFALNGYEFICCAKYFVYFDSMHCSVARRRTLYRHIWYIYGILLLCQLINSMFLICSLNISIAGARSSLGISHFSSHVWPILHRTHVLHVPYIHPVCSHFRRATQIFSRQHRA